MYVVSLRTRLSKRRAGDRNSCLHQNMLCGPMCVPSTLAARFWALHISVALFPFRYLRIVSGSRHRIVSPRYLTLSRIICGFRRHLFLVCATNYLKQASGTVCQSPWSKPRPSPQARSLSASCCDRKLPPQSRNAISVKIKTKGQWQCVLRLHGNPCVASHHESNRMKSRC